MSVSGPNTEDNSPFLYDDFVRVSRKVEFHSEALKNRG